MSTDQRVDLDELDPAAPTEAQLACVSLGTLRDIQAREAFARLPLLSRLFRRRPPGLGWWEV